MHGVYRSSSDERRIQPFSSLHMFMFMLMFIRHITNRHKTPLQVKSSRGDIWGEAPSCRKFKLPSAIKPLRTFRTLRQEALKTAVNRYTARLGEGNDIPVTCYVRRAQPACMKIVLT